MAKIKNEQVEKSLRKHIVDYRNKFNHFDMKVEWKINSKFIIKRLESRNQIQQMFNGSYFGLRFFHVECISKEFDRFLYSSIFKNGMEIKPDLNILEMKVTFISELCDMTSEHYLQQPKQMIERSLIKYLNKNLDQIKNFPNIPKPLMDFLITCT